MLKLSIALFMILSFSTLVSAQPNRPPDDACAFTFSSGTGHGLTQYCVTNNGNIAQFSAIGGNGLAYEFLNGARAAIEGYGLCDTTTPPFTAYWDFASSDSGNWNTATAVKSGNSVKVTRTTADGVWQLTQTITNSGGSKFFFGEAVITMAIKNLTNTDRFLILDRYANIDAGSSTLNDFDLTQTTIFGLVPSGNGPGLSSTAVFVTTPFDFSLAFVNKVPDAPIPCQSHGNFTESFFQGDGGVDQDFNLEIKPGQTKTVGVIYRPM